MDTKDRIKKRRLDLDMTLEQVAKRIGTSKQTIHRYESGVISNIPPEKIEALSKVLMTTPAYLMGWSDDESIVPYSRDEYDDAIDKRLTMIRKLYWDLNDDGKDKLLEYAEDLIASGRYIKSDYVSQEA